MRIDELKPYNPNYDARSDEPKEEEKKLIEGRYTGKVTFIKHYPLDLNGDESELFILTVLDGEFKNSKAFLRVYIAKGTNQWMIKNSQNLLSGLKECSGNSGAESSDDLLNAIVDFDIVNSKDGKYQNITRFYESTQQEFTADEIPF
jgi:hypothetical protein